MWFGTGQDRLGRRAAEVGRSGRVAYGWVVEASYLGASWFSIASDAQFGQAERLRERSLGCGMRSLTGECSLRMQTRRNW